MLRLIKRLIPPPLHRLLLRCAHRLRVAWWRGRRPLVLGVSIIARSADGRVVLIRQSYGTPSWRLPGGGLREGEDPLLAAEREFCEEVGCPITGLELVHVGDEPLHGARNRVHLVRGRMSGTPRPDGREVIEAGLFDPARLPDDTSRLTRMRLEQFGSNPHTRSP